MGGARLAQFIVVILINLLSKLDVGALFEVKKKCNECLLKKISDDKPPTSA